MSAALILILPVLGSAAVVSALVAAVQAEAKHHRNRMLGPLV